MEAVVVRYPASVSLRAPSHATGSSSDELAFLALECERLGAPAIGRWVIDEYEARSGDRLPPELVAFYRGYRACRRARLAAGRLRDPRADVVKWRDRARWYLNAAGRT